MPRSRLTCCAPSRGCGHCSSRGRLLDRERSLRSEPSNTAPVPRDEAPGFAGTEERGAGVSTTLLRGGRIHTPSTSEATALAVEDGVITWVGPAEDAPAADETVELNGAFVAPAFVDAHVHCTQAGLLRTGLDLTACASLAELLERVAARAGDGALIYGHGWDETAWPERRPPSRAEL